MENSSQQQKRGKLDLLINLSDNTLVFIQKISDILSKSPYQLQF